MTSKHQVVIRMLKSTIVNMPHRDGRDVDTRNSQLDEQIISKFMQFPLVI